MAALRLNYPGQPVRFVDLGPCPANLSSQGFVIRGGPIDARAPRPATNAQLKAAANRARPPQEWLRCGRVMRTGEMCGRRQGHSVGYCKSVDAVERDNGRRRTRDFGA